MINTNELFELSIEKLENMEKSLWDNWQKVSQVLKVKKLMFEDNSDKKEE